jgi:hypothetical protein
VGGSWGIGVLPSNEIGAVGTNRQDRHVLVVWIGDHILYLPGDAMIVNPSAF